ncbi:unnamed protein product [Peniophora sp. CBMAI 1063]|nr:unnamed protein product [Peniophora sp. CBMAI 1063]
MNAQELASSLNSDTDLIEVNGWYFCRHGSEYCSHCPQDQRSMNDDTMDQDLPMDYRKGLSVAGRIVNSGQRGPDGSIIWNCAVHLQADCNECFDWNKLMRAEGKKKDRGKVENRNLLMGLLASMGVRLPTSTKLPEDAIERKLTSAINYAQNFIAYSERAPFNPARLSTWEGTQTQSIVDCIWRSSYFEAGLTAGVNGGGPSSLSLGNSAFMDLRETVLHMAQHYNGGRESFVLQDEGREEAICIRILGVHVLDVSTPMISLVYAASTSNEPLPESIERFVAGQLQAGGVHQIRSNTQEQALLRRLLYINSTRVSSNYGPQLRDYEQQWKKTFLIPLGPLSQVQIGKLTNDLGCASCSNPATQQCTACLSVRYCSKACQKAHWKEHKVFCRSIRDGTWIDATFTDVVKGQRIALINARAALHPSVATTVADELETVGRPPRNVKGDRLFLVKLQRPASPAMAQSGEYGIAVYDRERTFTGYIMMNDENQEFWRQSIQQMPYGSEIMKVYRWARHTGDWKLSICIDREPRHEDIQW